MIHKYKNKKYSSFNIYDYKLNNKWMLNEYNYHI